LFTSVRHTVLPTTVAAHLGSKKKQSLQSLGCDLLKLKPTVLSP